MTGAGSIFIVRLVPDFRRTNEDIYRDGVFLISCHFMRILLAFFVALVFYCFSLVRGATWARLVSRTFVYQLRVRWHTRMREMFEMFERFFFVFLFFYFFTFIRALKLNLKFYKVHLPVALEYTQFAVALA